MICQIPPPEVLKTPLRVPSKLLLGPGPSNCPERILKASSHQMLGHLDKDFLKIMDEVKMGIKYAFQTENDFTFAVSGTGHCAMETAICNIIEPGDQFLVASSGIWGQRAEEMGRRLGAECHRISIPEGDIIDVNGMKEVYERFKPKALFICHGDSSTGLLQPLKEITSFFQRSDCVLIVDCVASLGAAPIFMDLWAIDVLYSGSQKVLNAPPGLSPISFSFKAIQKIKSRARPVTSFYMDALLLGNYWNCDGGSIKYHHTAPINLVYALRESLSCLAEETLEKCWERHKFNADRLCKKLEEIGLHPYISNKSHRLPSITTVTIPGNVNGVKVVSLMKQNFNLDIAGGLGSTAGKVWRIGLMGCNSNEKFVQMVANKLKLVINICQLQSSL